jgi:polyisoprenoid-binding protein YceI
MKLALLLAIAISASAADYNLQLAAETTQVSWTLGDVLHTVHGTFKLKRGGIHFDPESGKAGGDVVVDATSGNSGNGARDSRMHKNVLESQKYPDVSFAPDRVEGKVELTGTSTVKLHGIFTIHGAAHEITVPVVITAKNNQLTASIKFDVPYVAWGMKDPSTLFLKCNKSVEIEIQTAGHVAPGNGASR